MKKNRIFQKIKSALIVLVIALLIAEVFLQFRSKSLSYYVWSPSFSATLKVEEGTMPGITGDSQFTINESGVRGSKRTGNEKLSILAIGGSTTECFYLDNSEAWPYLVQEGLKDTFDEDVWVGNIGRSGLNAFHHVLTLEKGIDHYGNVDAVLFLVGVNDINRDLNRAFDISLDPRSMLDQTFMIQPKDTVEGFFERLELVRLTKNAFKTEKVELPEHIVQDASGSAYNKWRANRLNAIKIIDSIPSLTSQLEEYGENIEKLILLCEKNDTKAIFALQPSMYFENMPQALNQLLWMGGIGDFQGNNRSAYYSSRVMEVLISKYNDVIRAVCIKHNVDFIDLDTALTKDTTTFYDDCHFNEEGSRKVADEIINRLLSTFQKN